MAHVFISGATGFVGKNLAARLLQRGHRVRALVRGGSSNRLPAGCEAVMGDALDPSSFRDCVGPADTFVQLAGVSHPSPAKAALFRTVDLAAAKAAVEAASHAGIRHFVYVSVAHPAPVMKEYIAVREEAEELIRQSGLNATVLRPWYILGPGRWWPVFLMPMYGVMELLPKTRDSARRLGLITISQMLETMVLAIEQPPEGVRVLEVPQIRSRSLNGKQA